MSGNIVTEKIFSCFLEKLEKDSGFDKELLLKMKELLKLGKFHSDHINKAIEEAVSNEDSQV